VATDIANVKVVPAPNLADLSLIGDDGPHVGGNVSRQGDPVDRGPFAHEPDGPTDRVGEVELARLELHLAGLDLR